MILEYSYNFTIFVQVIEEWNLDRTFNNGVMLFEIEGDLFPKEIVNVTLNVAVPQLAECLRKTEEDEELFFMEKDEAARQLFKGAFPNDTSIDNDYRFIITPDEIQDRDYFLFAVRNKDDVRILATKIAYDWQKEQYQLENIYVKETYVPADILTKMSVDLKDYNEKIR